MTGTLQRRQGAQWTLKGGWRSAGGELYFCKEIDFEPLKDENYPFVRTAPMRALAASASAQEAKRQGNILARTNETAF